MNRLYSDIILDELKTKASRLLKASRYGDGIAIQKLSKLGVNRPSGWKLKDALSIIAKDYGFETWVDLKSFVENPFEERMTSRFLNHWFSAYGEAAHYRADNGGYLLPYKNQFFICQDPFIEEMGMSPGDESWREIGFDWVKPQNPRALFHLYEHLIKLRKK